MQKTFIKSLLLIIAFTFALSANYIFAVWTGPTQAPSGGNTPTPIHIGTIAQLKDGPLSLSRLLVAPGSAIDENGIPFTTNGESYLLGPVGIGTTNPQAKLDVWGRARVVGTDRSIVNFNYNDGTRDWGIYQYDQGGGSGNPPYNYLQNTVGIGTVAPSTGGEQDLKLDVEGAIGAKFYCDENGNNCASAPLGGGGNSIAFLANKNGINQFVSSPNNIIEWAKITFTGEEFDIGNYYNNANSRYTPPAGIYYIGASYTQIDGPRDMLIALHKNGVKIKEDYGNSNSGAGGSVPFGVVVSVNGTDYLELYAGFGANTVILGDPIKTYFYGFKIGI